ncbi:MAG: sigma-70 family RNA polymerase sigma factor, partial [Candidatus Binatia bacterium]
ISQGREDALVALHRRYVNMVYSLSLHILGDQMGTEEVTQDVFMKVWQHPRAYDPTKGRFSSWLLTVTRHTALDHLRKRGRRPSLVFTPDGKDQHTAQKKIIPRANPHPNPHQDLHILLGHLPSDQRQVIELAYFGGMSQQDVADVLGLTPGTVKTRIRLGMQKLGAMWHQNR